MALAKMVGLDVMPRMPSLTRCSSAPLVMYPRLRLSSQGLCPCSLHSACSFVSLNGFRTFLLGDEGPGSGRHVVGGEPQVLQDDLPRRRGAEPVDGDRLVGPAVPAVGRGRLDGELGDVTGQHRVSVRLVLLLEQLPAGHR